MIALIGQFSAASTIFSSLSPAGLTASDWRSSLSRNTLGAKVSHIAFPTHSRWSTRTRSWRGIAASYFQLIGSDFSDRKGKLGWDFSRSLFKGETGESSGL